MFLKYEIIRDFIFKVLEHAGCQEDCSLAVAEGLAQSSLRGVDSHGIRLFPHYLKALSGGRINKSPNFSVKSSFPSIALFDADHAFGHYAGRKAMEMAIAMADKQGIGAVAVANSTHFGAAACYGLLPALRGDMIGLSFTNASPLLKPPAGVKPFFGANPICFTAPMANEAPFCLDMSTTQITWNHVKAMREMNGVLPFNVAFDKSGQPTTDPFQADCLAPIGDYKGLGLSMMVDILCALLSGMPAGDQVSNMYSNPIEEKRLLGHFMLAIKIEGFTQLGSFKQNLQNLADRLRQEPHAEEKTVIVPGDPEKTAEAERFANGIPISQNLYDQFAMIADKAGFSLT